MKTIYGAALVGFGFGIAALAGAAQAHIVYRFLPKSGVPFTVPHQEPAFQAVQLVRPPSPHRTAHVKHVSRVEH